MNKKKKIILIISIVGITCLILSFGITYLLKIPSISEQIPENSTPIQIRILNPTTGSGWPLNYEIPVQVYAWGSSSITKIVLYINGIKYDEKINEGYESGDQQFLTQWYWQPGDKGDYLLSAQAFDVKGGNGISNSVLIQTGESVGTRHQIDINSGDSLEKLSADANIDLDLIQQANPGIDPKTPLSPEDIIYLPDISAPVSNPNIIPALESSSGGQPPSGSNGQEPDWDKVTPPKSNFLGNLIFSLSGDEESNQPEDQTEPVEIDYTLPYPPTLKGKYEGCDVKLWVDAGMFYDSGDPNLGELTKEDGFFLYRSRDGGEYERIATLPAYHTNESDLSKWAYVDASQYGMLTYYVSAFNKNGESVSPPVVIPLDQMNCEDPNLLSSINQATLSEEGDLMLPFSLDTAYLYVQINDGQATRVPEGDRFFLPGSGVKFNLYDYLDSISTGVLLTDVKVHMEVWGWLGGNLMYVGDIEHFVQRSVLSICSEEGQGACAEGAGGHWVQEMNILSNNIKPLTEQKYDIRWQITDLTEAYKICLSISPRTYTGPGVMDSPDILYFACYIYANGEYIKGNEGTITLEFGPLLYPEDKSQVQPYTGKAGEDFQDPGFQDKYPVGTPFTLSLRFVASVDDYQFYDTSNTVIMHYETQAAPPDLPPLASDVSSLYDIEILENTYQAPKYEIWEKWGCIIVDYDPNDNYGAGQELCPLSYVECGVNVDCAGFWDFVGAGWDYIVNLFNDAKGAIADFIADTIPGCSGSSACKDVIRKGIDYGVTALTGIPPDLPNFDQLVTQGTAEFIVGSLSGLSGEDIGYFCGDTCKDAIAAQILPYLKQAKSYYSQPGCFNPGGHYNMFPPCLDPSITVHPSQGSADFPGYVTVRVTRKNTPESLAADYAAYGKIKLYLTVDGENPSRAGYYYNECKYVGNIPLDQLPDPSYPNGLANRLFSYMGDAGLAEPLYKHFSTVIPWLEPGESIEIPVKLDQVKVFVDPNCIATARNQYLFFGGVSHMRATEYCYSSGSSWEWVPCTNGGQDSWDFANPAAP